MPSPFSSDSIRRFAPFFALLAGCYSSHGLESTGSPTGADASTLDAAPDATTLADTQECVCCGGATVTWPADTPCDLGACDGSCLPRCESVHAGVLEISIRNAGRPWQVGVPNESCECGRELECEASVAGDHVVQLHVRSCAPPDTSSCECEPWTFASCEMPSLDEGMWRVVHEDGRDAFGPVQVAPEESSIEQVPPRWQSSTLNSEHFEEMRWPPGPSSAREVCFSRNEDSTLAIEVEVCTSCAHPVVGGCSAAIEGGALMLTTSTQAPIVVDAINCEECVWRRRPCGGPVEAGSYRVSVDGLEAADIELGDVEGTGRVCFPVPL